MAGLVMLEGIDGLSMNDDMANEKCMRSRHWTGSRRT